MLKKLQLENVFSHPLKPATSYGKIGWINFIVKVARHVFMGQKERQNGLWYIHRDIWPALSEVTGKNSQNVQINFYLFVCFYWPPTPVGTLGPIKRCWLSPYKLIAFSLHYDFFLKGRSSKRNMANQSEFRKEFGRRGGRRRQGSPF